MDIELNLNGDKIVNYAFEIKPKSCQVTLVYVLCKYPDIDFPCRQNHSRDLKCTTSPRNGWL